MDIVVQKFGGTSVADTAKIIKITDKVIEELNKKNKIVLVISAMAGTTNALLSYCKEISLLINQDELYNADFILSNGENISTGLTALALQQRGIKSVALQGWQIPIRTNNEPNKALITSINSKIILQYLEDGFVPVICGYQGITIDNKITTLGRGGSDITAVAIAANVKAKRCDIYTDVSGVYSADPRLIPDAYKISTIGYESMLEFSHSGAKVLHPRSVEIAKEFKLDVRVISSFDNNQGTQIIENNTMELSKIIGITQNKNILLAKIHSDNGLNEVLEFLVEYGANIQNTFIEKNTISIITTIEELNKLEQILTNLSEQKTISDFLLKTDVAIITVIGTKLLNESNIVSRILTTIKGFDIQSLQVDHTKISILTTENNSEQLVKLLHNELIPLQL
jgi:aspartate kinase